MTYEIVFDSATGNTKLLLHPNSENLQELEERLKKL